ncbi:MAG: DNA cytosine methyltransferase [Pseudomonas sp.]
MMTGVPGTLMDLFTREQYTAFHGQQPPPGWKEATAEDLRRAAGNEDPNAVFISSPCKGASGLLSETMSQTPKYQALNELTLRCVWLMCEAWKHNPVSLIVFENVPRLATRGRHLLDQINKLLSFYGYAVAETTHDCGEIGGLAQSRKRFLLVARHVEKVPAFLYEPEKRSLQAVGDVLSRMPLAGDIDQAGPMHRVPALQWKTWVRLALVEAGKDWRSLSRFAIEDGHLRDFVIVPEYRAGYLGVHDWQDTAGTVAGRSSPTNGKFSVADPRPTSTLEYSQYGVLRFARHCGVVSGQRSPGQGTFSVADPRHAGPAKHSNEFRVVPWNRSAQSVTSAHGSGHCVQDPRRAGKGFGKYLVTDYSKPAGTVIAGSTTGQGAFAVADPAYKNWHPNASTQKLRITPWSESAKTVTGSQQVASGALSIADPRPGMSRTKGDAYLTGGHYGVVDYNTPAGAVSASACHDNGRWSVADQRMPAPNDRLTCMITSLDGTWHRPFTTLELAALQSLFDPEDHWSTDPQTAHEIQVMQRVRKIEQAQFFMLDGINDGNHRERIGNAVPRAAAKAMADVFGMTLLLSEAGETFMLSNVSIWVQPVAIALSVAQREVTL